MGEVAVTAGTIYTFNTVITLTTAVIKTETVAITGIGSPAHTGDGTGRAAIPGGTVT